MGKITDKLICPYCDMENDITEILRICGLNLGIQLEWRCEHCNKEYLAKIDYTLICESEKISGE